MTTSDGQLREVECYLNRLPPDSRATLEHLRLTIRELLPGATEVLSYGMPAFALDRPVVAYAAFKHHCSLFPLSAAVLDDLGEAVAGYRSAKGTLQFAIGGKLPKNLVRKIVKARVAENQARATERTARQKARNAR